MTEHESAHTDIVKVTEAAVAEGRVVTQRLNKDGTPGAIHISLPVDIDPNGSTVTWPAHRRNPKTPAHATNPKPWLG